MERFQEYRGINYQIDKPDKDNEELTDGKGYYLINGTNTCNDTCPEGFIGS